MSGAGIANSAWKSFSHSAPLEPLTTLWTPTAGTMLTAIKFFVPVAFNGTTPRADIGLFVETNQGFFSHGGGVVDLATVDGDLGAGANIIGDFNTLGESFIFTLLGITLSGSNPLQISFSQNGLSDGAAPESTVGTVHVHIEYFMPDF